ncbi:hypothetical protein BN874_130066 [Candidatus Contendobacter odensis Run_B_J11]|uniref:Uncharacterized protein n=1 Tax=Candidatus Contendobacter odensis Run_B_J11 TaxID=1400861 RepID=A0A7U7G929_9GAMM|nr:hypothetical protein BN874_130066 [Candidatus Contendobacter odensis Run_B_J11]
MLYLHEINAFYHAGVTAILGVGPLIAPFLRAYFRLHPHPSPTSGRGVRTVNFRLS